MVELGLGDFCGHAFEGRQADDAVDELVLPLVDWAAEGEHGLAEELAADEGIGGLEAVGDLGAFGPAEGAGHHLVQAADDATLDHGAEARVDAGIAGAVEAEIEVGVVGVLQPLAQGREERAYAAGLQLVDDVVVGEGIAAHVDFADHRYGGDDLVALDRRHFAGRAAQHIGEAKEGAKATCCKVAPILRSLRSISSARRFISSKARS